MLECLTGEVPQTHRDLVTKQQLQNIVGNVDSEFLTQLQALVAETDALVLIACDDDSRYNALVRDARQAGTIRTSFTLKPGDQVSYNGDTYVLLELIDSTPIEPTKANIRRTTHDATSEQIVRYNELRPLASPRPMNMHTSTPVYYPQKGILHFSRLPPQPTYWGAKSLQCLLKGRLCLSMNIGKHKNYMYSQGSHLCTKLNNCTNKREQRVIYRARSYR